MHRVASLATALVMLMSMPGLAADETNDICVTLLGTAGGPMGMSQRAGISSLVSAGGKHYLVDAGDGVTRQLAAVDLTGHDLGAVFLTHLHDDHTAGLPGLASFYYTTRGESMTVLGPPGTRRLVDGLVAFLQPNADIRNVENKLKRKPRDVFSAKEIEPGLVFSDEIVRVTAADNTHYVVSAEAFEGKQRTYALRFDAGDASIVLTGDTGVSEDVLALAQGADILVAEMATFSDIESVPPFVREHMVREHMSPAQAGQLAAEANAGRLVLSHVRDVAPADTDEISRHYDGPVVAGRDLDRFCVPAGD